MKKTNTPSAAKKPPPGTKPLTVQLEEAVRKADIAKTKAGIAKAALKKAKKAFKLARKAAKAARKEVEALQDVFQEAISRADGKSAAAAKKTSVALRAAMENPSGDSAKPKPRPPVKRKRVRKTSRSSSSDQPVAEVPPAEVVSSPTVVLANPVPAPSALSESEAAVPSSGDH